MITRTTTCDFDSLDEYVGTMEEAGWSVRQVLYVPSGVVTVECFVIVLEREP